MAATKYIKSVPWRKVLSVYFLLRSIFFTKKTPSSKGIYVDMGRDEIKKLFLKDFFNGRWMFSYNKRGEDLNVRREYFDEEYNWPGRQLHVRGYEVGDGMFLLPHEEVAPDGDNEYISRREKSHQDAHIDGEEFSREPAITMVEELLNTWDILEENDIEYTIYDSIEEARKGETE